MPGTYQYRSESIVWETPADLYAEACKKYNVNPKLDVCAETLTAKCKRFFTEEENALDQQWSDDFFMNPPYGVGGVPPEKIWVAKAYTEHKKHNVTGMALTFSKTDTQWWHEYVEDIAEVHFQKGRISFYKNGEKTAPAPRPSAWIIWRAK